MANEDEYRRDAKSEAKEKPHEAGLSALQRLGVIETADKDTLKALGEEKRKIEWGRKPGRRSKDQEWLPKKIRLPGDRYVRLKKVPHVIDAEKAYDSTVSLHLGWLFFLLVGLFILYWGWKAFRAGNPDADVLFGIGGGGIAIAALFYWFASKHTRRVRGLETFGVDDQAKVIHKGWEKSSPDGDLYTIVFAFLARNPKGKRKIVAMKMNSDSGWTLSPESGYGRLEPGDHLPIRYLPADPRYLIVDPEQKKGYKALRDARWKIPKAKTSWTEAGTPAKATVRDVWWEVYGAHDERERFYYISFEFWPYGKGSPPLTLKYESKKPIRKEPGDEIDVSYLPKKPRCCKVESKTEGAGGRTMWW